MFTTIVGAIGAIRGLFSASSLFVGIAKQVNWKIAIPVLFSIVLLGFSYYRGYSNAQQACKTGELARELAEVKQQLVRINNARVDAEKKTIDIDAKNVELSNKVSLYVADIEKRNGKGGACRLSANDLKRLRELREH